MSGGIDELMREYSEVLDMQNFDPSLLDYSRLRYHMSMLESIDAVDSGCISLFDLYKRKHIYYSPKYAAVLGWDPLRAEEDIAYTNSLIHPDDLAMLLRAGIFFIRMGFSMNIPAESKSYKGIFDYRVIGKDNQYVRVIEQQIVLEVDQKGNVWLALSLLDLAPVKDLTLPFSGRLMHLQTGTLYHFPPAEAVDPHLSPLSKREQEILQMIAKGLISKQIADKLYISVNTVNTHRQRIIEKLNVSNTYEAIQYAHRHGLF